MELIPNVEEREIKKLEILYGISYSAAQDFRKRIEKLSKKGSLAFIIIVVAYISTNYFILRESHYVYVELGMFLVSALVICPFIYIITSEIVTFVTIRSFKMSRFAILIEGHITEIAKERDRSEEKIWHESYLQYEERRKTIDKYAQKITLFFSSESRTFFMNKCDIDIDLIKLSELIIDNLKFIQLKPPENSHYCKLRWAAISGNREYYLKLHALLDFIQTPEYCDFAERRKIVANLMDKYPRDSKLYQSALEEYLLLSNSDFSKIGTSYFSKRLISEGLS